MGTGGPPTGTVTFLFTDLEGSTRLWEEHPEAMKGALARHDEVLRSVVEAHDGHVVKTTGDGLHAVFRGAVDAANAALAAQGALRLEQWTIPDQLCVRMGIHTGEAEERDGDYFGTATNRAARLMAAANGGQILVSLATEELVRDALTGDQELADLGEHRLRDLARPERIFELRDGGTAAALPVRSLDAYPSNLPVQLTSFVGRDADVAAITAALQETRLVTLVGVGGVGKTRLATQVAAEVLPRFARGAWLCELAAATDPEALEQVVAATLGVNQRAGVTVGESIVDFLRTKNLLMVLDNCEHLLDAAGVLAEDVLQSCPDVRILATSREGLAVPGEQVWPLRSLRVPASATDANFSDIGAVRLFVERARAVRPSFALDGPNREAVLEICRRLDGIPLAIELASARVEAMSAPEIAELLDERFRLLTGGRRTAVERHQTLRAAVDWSYSLLTEVERQVFDRLGVFSGFDAAAATDVVSGDGVEAWDVRDALTALVSKSLVVREETAEGVTRYQMLETLRQYARERLDAAGETDRWRRRHAEHLTAFAEEAGPALLGPNELEWRPRVGHELDNLRAAVFWGLDHGDPADVENALRIITALAYEGTMRRTAGVATWAERALEHIDDATPPGSRMAIRGTAALASVHRSEWDRANDLAEQALEAGVTPDCPSPNIAIVARCMGRMYAGDQQGAIEMARSYIEELDRLQASSFDRANIRNTTAIWLLVAGDVRDAPLLADESLRMARSIGNPSAIAMATETLAWSLERSEPARALELHDEAIALIRSGASDVMLTNALMRSARLCASAGKRLEALRRLREAILHSFDDADQPSTGGALDIGIVILVSLGCDTTACTIAGGVLGRPRPLLMTPADDAVERDTALEAVLSRLGNVSFEQTWSAGVRMTYEDLVHYAVRELEQLMAETRP